MLFTWACLYIWESINQIKVMETVIAPTTSNTMFIHGVFFNGSNFVNRYGDILSNTWVVACYWTRENSRFGEAVANLNTKAFCDKHGIPDQKYGAA